MPRVLTDQARTRTRGAQLFFGFATWRERLANDPSDFVNARVFLPKARGRAFASARAMRFGLLFLLAACSSPAPIDGDASTVIDAGSDAGTDVAVDASNDVSSDATGSCTTRIEYGAAWMAPANHPNDYDVADGSVTWDGACTTEGKSSYATLSNGMKPYFTGASSCVIALDSTCGSATCATRVGHDASHDDLPGRVFSDGTCANGKAKLSNGDTTSCPTSFGYTQCGGLYTNPIMPTGCADPGVLKDDDGTYVLSCTSGGAANAFPIYTSKDLVRWKAAGHVFPSGKHPSWTTGNAFWAPEIHKVGTHYVVYFSAENKGGLNAVGAASAPSATGPFTDIGAPLVVDSVIGVIDASEINTSKNESYVIWKTAGLGVGKPTPIHSQKLAADGLSVTGNAVTLITNDQPWEGKSTEGPFMVEHGGMFYLFYSGGIYTNATYAVGVARAATPHEPMTKLPNPILETSSDWVGPGHCSVTLGLSGQSAIVYHAWKAGCAGGTGCSRWLMLDAIAWGTNGWPSVVLGPSSSTRPLF